MSLGKWICIEGPDRIGKTSLGHALKDIIEKKTEKPVYFISLPVREGNIWNSIKEYLTGGKDIPKQALDLLFVADFWVQSVKILEHLKHGGWVITDRWFSSTAVYSCVRDYNLCKGCIGNQSTCSHVVHPIHNQQWIENLVKSLPAPDITIWLDCNVELLKTRPGWGDEREETEELQKQVIEGYRKWFTTNNIIPKNTVYHFMVTHDLLTNVLSNHIAHDYIFRNI